MRTLGFTRPDKQRRVAQETLDIFAPLANRLGIWQMKWELEDLAFRYVNPEKYKEIAEQLAERRDSREHQIEEIIKKLHKILAQHNIKAEISGRPKHIYSIYKKMLGKGKAFEMVRDIRAVRLIVPDIPACYTTLGIIHTHWRPIPNEFDDYIAAPKDNFYQSLHTAFTMTANPSKCKFAPHTCMKMRNMVLPRIGAIKRVANTLKNPISSVSRGCDE
jgi:guanosine-3',5'-bis(diphosphate) 3'-pyrophosphohydrolase